MSFLRSLNQAWSKLGPKTSPVVWPTLIPTPSKRSHGKKCVRSYSGAEMVIKRCPLKES
jgi:hypothetical protein